MDFVKTEDQNNVEDENYDVYMNNLPDYQHTPISMEQLHQAMQSSLNSVHNLQLPLSPRQMSTLMLKTNQLTRNFNFNDIPAHLARNLTAEMNLAHNLSNELQHNMRHEDILNQNLRNTLDMTLARNLNSELDLHNNLTQSLVQSMNEQDLTRSLNAEMNETLSRVNDLNLPSNLIRDHELSNELDLSQLSRQNLEVLMNNEERRNVLQNNQLDSQSLIQRLDQNIIQRLDPNLIQRLDPNLVLRLDQRIEQRLETTGLSIQEAQRRLENEPIPTMPFHIKMEQEDDSYYYAVNQQINNASSVNGYLPGPTEQATPDNQVYSVYNNQIPNIPLLNSLDLYSRPQNFTQSYVENNVSTENPQNLVIQRDYQNSSPYTQENFKKTNQNSENSNSVKSEEANENLKPSDENKLYYPEYQNNVFGNNVEKNENDPSVTNNKTQDYTANIRGEYECYKCHKVLPSKRGLKQHAKACVETEDGDEKVGRFSCSQCAYRCQSPAILKIHERTHTGEKPFACSFCDYKSGQKNNVAKHILVHMKEKPFRCQYCDYRCAQKNNLVVHERTHTGFKPFACPYCDYRTVQKPNLVKHMYLHTDQKPFSCDQCSYRCVQKTNLTKHKQRHLNEKSNGEKLQADKVVGENVIDKNLSDVKPYKPRQKSVKCPQCSYRCVQKSSLVKHLQFKHNVYNVTDESFDHELMSVKSDDFNENAIQNLSVKKDANGYIEANDGKSVEPLQIQS